MTMGIELETLAAEVGHHFSGRISRDADTDGSKKSRARSVRLVLRAITEGRGDTDRLEISHATFDLADTGALPATAFTLAVPASSPVSYDGRLIRIRYEIEAQVDLKLARDEKFGRPVLVVPTGGLGVYEHPHPLPFRQNS